MKIFGKIMLGALALLLILLTGLALAGGELLRRPVERMASAALERKVTIDHLNLHLLSRTPGVWLSGLKVANPDWVQGTPGNRMAEVGDLTVALRLLPLLRGEVVLAHLGVDNADVSLLREAGGRANWSFGSAKDVSGTAPLALPVVDHLYVRNSRLKVQDAVSKIAFDGEFSTEEGNVKAGTPLALRGRGQLNGQPFRLDLSGGAVAKVVTNEPYPFDLLVTHGVTRITAKGTFANALELGDFTAAMTLKGRNLADLYYLTGLALPSTSGYDLGGTLSRKGRVFSLTNLNGRLGRSDMQGSLSVDTAGARPLLVADLRSRLLDPADAGVVFAGGEDGGAPALLLPDKPLELARLRGMDAKVHYKAAAINVDVLPLKQVDLTMVLDNGRLVIAPLAVTLPQGTVSGSLVIDASKDVPVMEFDVRLSGARLEDFMAKAGQPHAIEGPLVGRVKLAGAGRSFHDAAAHADGTAALVIPRGQIRQAFAELLGINVARGLGLLLSGDQKQVALRCGIASFEAKQGVLSGQHIVFDTDTVVAVGSGSIRMADESLDLTLRGKPKKARLVNLNAPVQITGTLLNPGVGVGVAELGMQAAAATAAGIVLTPLAAILPFVDAGLAEDANCGALLREVKAAS